MRALRGAKNVLILKEAGASDPTVTNRKPQTAALLSEKPDGRRGVTSEYIEIMHVLLGSTGMAISYA
jgi:hypothetical protein